MTSGAALATVVGVLVEVPVMLSVCRLCNQSRPWYQRSVGTGTCNVMREA
jgi:ACR3 family arsenite transporter